MWLHRWGRLKRFMRRQFRLAFVHRWLRRRYRFNFGWTDRFSRLGRRGRRFRCLHGEGRLWSGNGRVNRDGCWCRCRGQWRRSGRRDSRHDGRRFHCLSRCRGSRRLHRSCPRRSGRLLLPRRGGWCDRSSLLGRHHRHVPLERLLFRSQLDALDEEKGSEHEAAVQQAGQDPAEHAGMVMAGVLRHHVDHSRMTSRLTC